MPCIGYWVAGSVMPQGSIMWPTASVGLRQIEHPFGNEREDELFGDRGDPRQDRFPEQPLDLIFTCITHAAMGEHGLRAGAERRPAGEEFRGIRLRPAGLAAVVERSCPQTHPIGGFEEGPAFGERMLNALVLADRQIGRASCRERVCQYL